MRRLVLGLSLRNSLSAGAAKLAGIVCLLLCVSSAGEASRGSSVERGYYTALVFQTPGGEN